MTSGPPSDDARPDPGDGDRPDEGSTDDPDGPGREPGPHPGHPPPGGGPPDGGLPAYPTPDGPEWGDPLVPTSFSGWLSTVVGVVGRSWLPLLLIQLAFLPLFALFALLGVVVTETRSPGLGLIIGLLLIIVVVVVALILQGAAVHYVTMDADGTRVSLGEALRFGRSRAGILFGWGVLFGLLIVVGPLIGLAVAVGVGFDTTAGLLAIVLLSLPALYLSLVNYAALLGVVMFERQGIGRCFSLVHRRFLPTVGRMLLTGLAGLVWYALVTGLVSLTLGTESPAGTVVSQVLAIPAAIVAVAVQVVTYAELRVWEAPGQVTTQRLAAEIRQG